jgi:hypothetical protein
LAFFLAAVLFFFAGDGDGEAAVAAVVEVADVPCCCVQETMNAMPIRAMINDKTDFFIVMVKINGSRMSCRSLDARK